MIVSKLRQQKRCRNTHRNARSKFGLSESTSLLAAMLESSHIHCVRSRSSVPAVQSFGVVLHWHSDTLGGGSMVDWLGWRKPRMRCVERKDVREGVLRLEAAVAVTVVITKINVSYVRHHDENLECVAYLRAAGSTRASPASPARMSEAIEDYR